MADTAGVWWGGQIPKMQLGKDLGWGCRMIAPGCLSLDFKHHAALPSFRTIFKLLLTEIIKWIPVCVLGCFGDCKIPLLQSPK